tara:strand:- start:771 stop:1031 length:261 start_codon:yes stop_codon:yes gene_type:complete
MKDIHKYIIILLLLLLLVTIVLFINRKTKETFITNSNKINPYYKENKGLKYMIAEMANDALHNKLKKAPTLIDISSLDEVVNRFSM